jgi:hypothetical protein
MPPKSNEGIAEILSDIPVAPTGHERTDLRGAGRTMATDKLSQSEQQHDTETPIHCADFFRAA